MNLDETGATPGRDCNGVSDGHFYLTRRGNGCESGSFFKFESSHDDDRCKCCLRCHEALVCI